MNLLTRLRDVVRGRRDEPVPPEFRVSAGVHRHHKGPLYQVLGLAHDANTPGRVVVVYVPLELDGAHEGPRLAVRHLDRSTIGDRSAADGVVLGDPDCWLDEVPTAHGDARNLVGARPVPRFRWLGPTYQAWMRDGA